jgi:hypothetical protein
VTCSEPREGPGTHYALFAGLGRAGVDYLVTGATALVLHGVPRLTPDVERAIDPDPANVARCERLLASWGYGESGAVARTPGDPTVRRFRHPFSALGEIDVFLPAPQDYARLRAGSAAVHLVDVAIPLVGADELRARALAAGTAAGREDAEGLEILAALRAGAAAGGDETRREQIRKFSRWSIAARCDWLLAAARLAKGMAPEARPLTRGLVRRRGWYGRP